MMTLFIYLLHLVPEFGMTEAQVLNQYCSRRDGAGSGDGGGCNRRDPESLSTALFSTETVGSGGVVEGAVDPEVTAEADRVESGEAAAGPRVQVFSSG